MSRTLRKSNNFLDSWNYQNSSVFNQPFKNQLLNSIQDQILDPYSDESLAHYRMIESFFIQHEFSQESTQELENIIFQKVLYDLQTTKKGSLSLIKRNFESVLLKRKILPQECFVKHKFIPSKYKKFLFQELCQQSQKHHSLLTLSYHFASELQEASAILTGEMIDLEQTTLEFILFAEHQLGTFKHNNLFITDRSIIETSLYIRKNNPKLTEEEHFNLLKSFYTLSKTMDETSFLTMLIEFIRPQQFNRSLEVDLKEHLNPIQLLSFYKHFENLLKMFDSQKNQIVYLVENYLNSIQKNELFIEKDFFFEIPILVELLNGIVGNQSNLVISFFKTLIDGIENHQLELIDLLPRKQNDLQSAFNIFKTIYNLQEEAVSIHLIELITSTFKAFKSMPEKSKPINQIELLSKEGFLVTKRIPLEKSLC